MGKTKNSNVKVAPVSVPQPLVKPAKKGKRVAVESLDKKASAKRQKKKVVEVAAKPDEKKSKKASHEPPAKKQPKISSSEDLTSSESEEEVKVPHRNNKKPAKPSAKASSSSEESSSDEEPVKNASTLIRKPPPTTPKNGSVDVSKKEEGESSDGTSDESAEDPQKTKTPVTSNVIKPSTKITKKDTSSDEDDSSEESSDEEPPKAQLKKTVVSMNVSKAVTKVVKKASSSSEDEDDSGDGKLLKAQENKGTDVKMNDDPTSNATDKSTAGKTEKKPATPAKHQIQTSGSKTLFVGNLSFDVERDDVIEFFKEVGEVVQIRLAYTNDGWFRGFCHVEFSTEEAAKKALELNGQEYKRRVVKIEFSRERNLLTHDGKVQSQTIFIKGFDKYLEADEIRSSLKEHFGSCGVITRVSIIKERESSIPKGFAYLDFEDLDGATKALDLNGSNLGGYTLTVETTRPKSDKGSDGLSAGRGGGRDRGGRGGGGGGRGDTEHKEKDNLRQ